MDGKVRVLLVSAGAAPEALVAELERLGVEITSCAFADAEEVLETEPPDLVALAGALGAIELANMIDDLEDGPRMVIVAERRELAKLRGLNREVVVSLFAMETTEKVVGQRIESLARRAARRREHKAAPDPKPLKKTAMGLPSAAQVAKVDLKKMEAPPSVRPKPPVTAGERPVAAKPPAPEPPAAEKGKSQRVAPQPRTEARNAEKASPSPEPREGEKPEGGSRDQGEAKAPGDERGDVVAKVAKNPPPIKKPEAPARPEPRKPPIPVRTPREEAEQSIMVIDEDLLESILPDAPDGDIPEISILSMMSVAPDPDEAPVSHPPTLPPAAKAQSTHSVKIQPEAAPEELDISDAESALENLDSVKLEITQDLVAQAQKEMSDSGPDPYNEDTKVGHVEGGGMAEPDETATDPKGNEVSGAAAAFSLDKTLPLEAAPEAAQLAAQAQEETGADPEASKADGVAELELDEGTSSPTVEVESDIRQGDGTSGEPLIEGAPVSTMLPGVTKEKGGGGKAFGLILLVAAAVGGVYVFRSGALDTGGAGSAEAQADSPDTQQPAARPPSEASADPKAPEGTDDQASEKSAEEPAANEQPSEPTESGPDAEEQAEQPSAEALENPFKRPLTSAPSCESLVAGHPPEQGGDRVHLASEAWDEARAAIVGGKLDEAHLFMCQAVTLNPESAAIEGLAGHYLALGDYEKALKWAEKADSLRPGQMDIGNLKGDIYAMRGDVDEARKIWLDQLNIGPDQYSRLVPISKDYSVEAGRHLRRGDLVRAELFFRRAVILDPENLNGIIGLAKVYHRAQMPSYARAFCEMSLKVSDVIPEVHVLLGELALAEGKKEEARARFERALAVRPGFFPAKRGLSQVK